jgi:hypothetical protein
MKAVEVPLNYDPPTNGILASVGDDEIFVGYPQGAFSFRLKYLSGIIDELTRIEKSAYYERLMS